MAPFMRFSRTRLSSVLTLFVVLSAAPSAYAVPTDAALAEGLFTSGKEAMARGDLVAACPRFFESLKLDPAVGTLLNLATCEERSGKLTSALEHFTTARGQLARDDFRIRFTTEQIESLGRRVAHVTLRPPSPGAKVLRDGVELAPSSFNVVLAMDPGAHTLVVETPGVAPVTTELMLREGEARGIDLGSAPQAAAGPASFEHASPPNTLAYAVLGVGAVGLATGAITGLLAIRAAGTYRDHCESGVCDPDGLSAASTGKTMSIVSPIAFAVGALGVGAGAYLLLSAPKRPRASTAIVPSVSPSAAGVSITRSF